MCLTTLKYQYKIDHTNVYHDTDKPLIVIIALGKKYPPISKYVLNSAFCDGLSLLETIRNPEKTW